MSIGNVNVTINQDLKTAVSKKYRDQLNAIIAITKEKDPGIQFQNLQKYKRLQRNEYGGHEFEILNEIRGIFLPLKFRKFVTC